MNDASLPANRKDDLVTLCAWSHTVKFEGEWISVEQYLSRRFGLAATHGISPDAMEKLEAEMDAADDPGAKAGKINNPRRLAALHATALLDSAPSAGFDRVTRIGAALLNAPAAFISLVDKDRDFYLSNCGFGEPLASERQLTGQTFCHFTIESGEPTVIADTRADPVYCKVPTVETLGVAAYLGVPLTLLSGEVIGAFCVIDQVPREWTPAQIQGARDLASLVVSEIELRQTVASSRAALNPVEISVADSPPA